MDIKISAKRDPPTGKVSDIQNRNTEVRGSRERAEPNEQKRPKNKSKILPYIRIIFRIRRFFLIRRASPISQGFTAVPIVIGAYLLNLRNV